MRRVIFSALAFFAFSGTAFAATTTSHTVTVTVSAINEVAVAGGNLALTINTASAGSNPDAVSDSTTNDLSWTTNETTKKITVATDLVSPT